MHLRNKAALITGGSRGIGAAIAQRLSAEGAQVAITYATRENDAAQIVQVLRKNGPAMALRVDLSKSTDLSETFEQVVNEFGRLDIVVANAGDVMSKSIAESTIADFDAAFAVNARGTFLTLVQAARRLPTGGRIVALSSILTEQPRAGMGLYAASKATVEQLIRALAHELGPRSITVNAVSPGPTDTSMLLPSRREQAPKQTPLGRLGTPQDIADVVAFLASDDARWITGQVIRANGGML